MSAIGLPIRFSTLGLVLCLTLAGLGGASAAGLPTEDVSLATQSGMAVPAPTLTSAEPADALAAPHEAAAFEARRRGQFGDAEWEWLQALGILKSRYGDGATRLTEDRVRLAQLYVDEGRDNLARFLLIQSLEVETAAGRLDAPANLTLLLSSSGQYAELDRFGRAQELMDRALRLVRSPGAVDEAAAVNALDWAGELAWARYHYDAADALLTEARSRGEALWSPGDPRTMPALFNLAKVQRARHHYDKAQALLEQAKAIGDQQGAPGNTNRVRAADDLGEVLITTRHAQAAELMLKAELTRLRLIPGASKWLIARLERRLGLAYVAEGRALDGRAEAAAADALEIEAKAEANRAGRP